MTRQHDASRKARTRETACTRTHKPGKRRCGGGWSASGGTHEPHAVTATTSNHQLTPSVAHCTVHQAPTGSWPVRMCLHGSKPRPFARPGQLSSPRREPRQTIWAVDQTCSENARDLPHGIESELGKLAGRLHAPGASSIVESVAVLSKLTLSQHAHAEQDSR